MGEKSFLEGAIRNPKLIGTGIIISIVLIYIGIINSMFISSDYTNNSQGLLIISAMIYNLGILWLVLIFLGLGIGRSDYPQWVRVALIVGAFLLVLFGLMGFKDVLLMWHRRLLYPT